jgi:beta-ureidopropionase / N-carbamoyl-L-amino-acid hydrolase
MAVRSRDGVIHHPTEFTTPADHAVATQILADMLYTIAVEGVQAISPNTSVTRKD